MSRTYSAKGPWNKSLLFFPIKYVIPQSLKVSHWLSQRTTRTAPACCAQGPTKRNTCGPKHTETWMGGNIRGSASANTALQKTTRLTYGSGIGEVYGKVMSPTFGSVWNFHLSLWTDICPHFMCDTWQQKIIFTAPHQKDFRRGLRDPKVLGCSSSGHIRIWEAPLMRRKKSGNVSEWKEYPPEV